MQQRNKGLQALVMVTIMFVAAATIFAGTASADPGPTVVPVPPIPSGITHTDPCGPKNAEWNDPPDSVQSVQFNYSVDHVAQPNHLLVDDFNSNEVFPDGSTRHDYGPAPDSGVACPPAVYAPHGKIIVKCGLRVSYIMDNRGSNRTVLYTAAWSYGKTKVVKRVYVKAHSKVTVTLYRVHRSARATLVARSRLLASVAHVTYRRC